MQSPPGAPTSPLFAIRDTPHSGRAVFSTACIPADTLLLRSDDLALSVLLREYRREVCGQCFDYEHGRDLKIRDAGVGFSFCSEDCQMTWRAEQGEVGVQAWTKVEGLVKGRSKEDDEMVDIDLPRPREKEIREAWDGVKAQASLILVARQGERDRLQPLTNGVDGQGATPGVQVTKQHRKALQKALLQPLSPDTLSFCVAGLLWKYNKPDEWDRVMALASDETPYHNTPDLQAFINTYLHLLSILPLPLLPLCTPETLFLLSSRDSHNSFGIRSLEDDGSEFFGYGCWPAASYFNHSCAPNVEKRRVGRVWEFWTGKGKGRGVEVGEELCISYLSGEERGWGKGRRALVLRRNWGFGCGCVRCVGV